MILFYQTGVSEVGGWFDVSQNQFSLQLIINHVIMLGQFDSFKFNTVIWSLVHEMRISLIFPLIMLLVMKFDWKISAAITVSITILFFLVYYICIKFYQYDITASMTSYLSTVRYIPYFVLGALLAKQRKFLHAHYNKISLKTKVLLVIMGILTYTYVKWFFPSITILHLSFLDDWAVGIGSSIFIVFSMNSKTLKSFMLAKPVHFVGKISYSIYLYHMIVILTLLHAFYGKLPIGTILISSIAISFIIASFMYYVVEEPSIIIGRYLTRNKLSKMELSEG